MNMKEVELDYSADKLHLKYENGGNFKIDIENILAVFKSDDNHKIRVHGCTKPDCEQRHFHECIGKYGLEHCVCGNYSFVEINYRG